MRKPFASWRGSHTLGGHPDQVSIPGRLGSNGHFNLRSEGIVRPPYGRQRMAEALPPVLHHS